MDNLNILAYTKFFIVSYYLEQSIVLDIYVTIRLDIDITIIYTQRFRRTSRRFFDKILRD